MAARLIAFLCHRLQQQQVGTTAPVRSREERSGPGRGFSHLEKGPAYPRVTESDPVLHPVPKGLKAQIGVIAEVADHAHVLPATTLDLEQLQTESAEGGGYPRAVSREKTSGVYRPGVWENRAMATTEAVEGSGEPNAGSWALPPEDSDQRSPMKQHQWGQAM